MSERQEDDRGRLKRRALSFSLTVVAAALVIGSLPLTLPLIALVDLVRRRRFAWTRALLMVAWILVGECWGILVLFGLWLVRPLLGRERFAAANYAVQAAWVRSLLAGVRALQSMALEVRGAEAARRGPFLILARHVSTADTLLPITAITAPFGLRPRYVLKAELRWDPCLDLVGHRVPNAFVRRGAGAREVERSAALAEGLGPRDVVVVYPEGTRFTRRAQARRLAELEGRDDPLLAQARALRHTLPPRSGGVLGILRRAPGLDVVFLAHVGLEGARDVGDLLAGRLIDQRIEVEIRRVPAAAIPADDEGRRRWLFEEWARIDRWVAERSE
ncbi:MAG: 1-acyl-sn-glycerol-3-phosphate acyltransferase [Myxococcales bacterium]|nr:1-acyl-sn-glycerol-3-phosphate acyltransferase [Myxococcales bacterium]